MHRKREGGGEGEKGRETMMKETRELCKTRREVGEEDEGRRAGERERRKKVYAGRMDVGSRSMRVRRMKMVVWQRTQFKYEESETG